MGMRLIVLDENKMPTISPEALSIKCFYDLWRRTRKINGDSDGRLKIRNLQEVGYIYFSGVYDSRFKLKKGKEKETAIKKLIGLPEEWESDALIKECLDTYIECQVTASSELVDSLEGGGSAVAKYLTSATEAISNGTINTIEPKQVKDIMDIIDRAPDTIKKISEAKSVLQKEQDSLTFGRKGRDLNKFEMPDQ